MTLRVGRLESSLRGHLSAFTSLLPLSFLLLLLCLLTLVHRLPDNKFPFIPVHGLASPVITRVNLPQVSQQQVIPSALLTTDQAFARRQKTDKQFLGKTVVTRTDRMSCKA